MNLTTRFAVLIFVLALVWHYSFGLLGGRNRAGSSREPKKNLHKTIVYTYGLTIAEVKREPFNGNITYCKLIELKTGDECTKILENVTAPIRHLCAKKMMNLIVQCMNSPNEGGVDNVGDDTGFLAGLISGIYPVPVVHRGGRVDVRGNVRWPHCQICLLLKNWPAMMSPYGNSINNRTRGLNSEVNVMDESSLGTKWCGAGHRAKNYFDLGLEVELDKCCRAHDHCPIKVGPWALGFGGRNWALYTISHCDCDTDFFNCLAEVDNQAADTIGVLYFNTMKVPCLRESPQVKLCPPATSSERCPTAHLQDMLVLNSFQPEYVFYEKNRTRPR